MQEYWKSRSHDKYKYAFRGLEKKVLISEKFWKFWLHTHDTGISEYDTAE